MGHGIAGERPGGGLQRPAAAGEPDAFQHEDLARRLVEDLSLPERGALP
ncbi:Acetyltransferase [Streptomyces sp. PVA_94-07]|nr:Acetyltransferase [Streptomyces sp. PVA_94-07]